MDRIKNKDTGTIMGINIRITSPNVLRQQYVGYCQLSKVYLI
jgi:hypothetical protein